MLLLTEPRIYGEDGTVTEKYDAVLSAAGCYKAAEFINFCDAFEIPVLSLTNVKGFKADKQNEKGIANAAAKLTYAFANATVPKVNVIIGQAYGSAYVTMNSKAIGADITMAWPDAKIGTMDAKLAAKIICDGQGARCRLMPVQRNMKHFRPAQQVQQREDMLTRSLNPLIHVSM